MSASSWGLRALSHVKAIVDVSPERGSATAGRGSATAGRGSATEAESRAAEYVRSQLSSLGIADVRIQPFRGLRSIWLFLAVVYGFALIGHAAFWLLRRPLGNLPALLVSILTFAFAGFLLWRKFTYRDYPLRHSLPHGPSQNVVAVLPATGETHRRVVLTAHLDSHRAVWIFANDLLVIFFFLTSPIGLYGVAVTPLLYSLAVITQLQVFAWIGLISILSHFLGWFTGVTADLGPYSPGANDNASAVGTLLALAERLQQFPLEHTEVWLAFTGCEETGCDGMAIFLKEYGKVLKDSLFVNFELVGIGDRLVYIRSEGVVRKRWIPRDVERLVLQAGRDLGICPTSAAGLCAFTETGVVWERGLDGVCLVALRKGIPFLPEWHRLTDRADRLQPETLDRVHEMAWKLLQNVDDTSP